jgi:hypothetical protein
MRWMQQNAARDFFCDIGVLALIWRLVASTIHDRRERRMGRRRNHWSLIALGAAVFLACGRAWAGSPPAQKLPSALLVYPLIQADSDQDTRVELLNLSGTGQSVQCFYVGSGCGEIGFSVFLTAYQPMAWVASAGWNDPMTGTYVPPFFGMGELKCGAVPPHPEVEYHNTIQGRATIFSSSTGATVSYGAVGFQRLSDGGYTGVFSLNGSTYAQCPSKLHFDVLTDQPGSASQIILVPCTENLFYQIPTAVTVQIFIYNEFEQGFSTSYGFTCFDERSLSEISGALTRAIAGTDTAHLVVRGVGGPVLGLVIDQTTTGTAGNEPSFDGGSSATVTFPVY